MKNYIIENRVTGMLLLAIICIFCVSVAMNAQNYKIEGKTITSLKPDKSSSELVNTGFTWVDNKGKSYPIFISDKGCCFVIKTSSKTNKDYRNYLSSKISQDICKRLNIEYKGKK